MRTQITLVALALGLSAGSVAPTAGAPLSIPASCPANAKLADLLAGSDLVLLGTMDVPRRRLADQAQKSAPEYVDIPILVHEVLKGAAVGNAAVRFYPKDTPYKPTNQAVLGLAGTPAILFLTRVDEGPIGLYFAGDTPDALSSGTGATVDTTRAEVARQVRITRSYLANPALPRFSEVTALIARLGRVSGGEQQRVFDRLVALGETAVPAIVAQMDVRRPLRTQAIALENHSPNAFEGTRHYGPEQVVDGLDAVLNQITGASYGSIMNGGSDRQRGATVAGWRVHASDLVCSKRP